MPSPAVIPTRPSRADGTDGRGKEHPAAPIISLWQQWRNNMGKGILLWLIGVPIPVILILWLLFR